MKGTSIFTEYLQELTRYSAKIDRATFREADFVELQKLQERITAAYNHNYFTLERRQMLRRIACHLTDEGREAIRITEEAKRISREIDKQRRAEKRAAQLRTA